MGGLDWSHLQLAADFYGIADLEALVEALVLIKTHRAAADRGDEPEEA